MFKQQQVDAATNLRRAPGTLLALQWWNEDLGQEPGWMRMYQHCIKISRPVVSAELTCDDGLWRKVAGWWKKEARLKRSTSQISRAYKPSFISTSRARSAKHKSMSFVNCTLLSNLRNGKYLSSRHPERKSQLTTVDKQESSERGND
jgi:hypothetical protein